MVQVNLQSPAADPSSTQNEIAPPGRYHARIIWTERKEYATKTGAYLMVKVALQDRYENCRAAERLHLWHSNKEVADRNENILRRICRIAGLELRQRFDTADLHGRAVDVDIDVETWTNSSGEDQTRNIIKRWHPANRSAEIELPGARQTPATPATPLPQQQPQQTETRTTDRNPGKLPSSGQPWFG